MSFNNKITPSIDNKYSVDHGSDAEKLERSDTEDASSCQICTTKLLGQSFTDSPLENTYTEYYQRQKRTCIPAMFVFSFVFNLSSIAMNVVGRVTYPETEPIPHIVLAGVFLLINIILFGLYQVAARSLKESLQTHLPWIMWLIIDFQIFLVDYGFAFRPQTPAGSVGWLSFFVYITFVLFPFQLRWCILRCVLVLLSHTIIGIVMAATVGMNRFYYGSQVGANSLIFLCAVGLGVLSFISLDKRQRKAFLETKASLSIKVAIEEKSMEQERLLLSVLPKHVADDMLKDMAAGGVTGQFRKIYMDRHENVSILFADIVGFTALSSMCTATELVKVLNELFASFDILAKKYHQLRIKILGDCYYCISGAPTPRSDHAVLSVHMGLSVVEAIRMVREKTKSNVNMRVGIHTGAVLGGVIGQKQWQFDVLGKEVNLANKMESGGLPGRVHLSDTTASFLNGEFELEPGEGDTREDAIKHAGMKTYIIKSIIKPYPQNTLDEGLETVDEDEDEGTAEGGDATNKGQSDESRLLLSALSEQENSSHMSQKLNRFTLKFKNGELENQYSARNDHNYTVSMIGLLSVKCAAFIAQLFIFPKNMISFVTFGVGLVFLVVMIIMSTLFKFDKPATKARPSDKRWFRIMWAVIAITFTAGGDIVDFILGCHSPTPMSANGTFFDPNSMYCEYPNYFPYLAVLALIGVTFMLQIGFIVKSIIMFVIAVLYILGCMLFVRPAFDRYDDAIYDWFLVRNSPTAVSSTILLVAMYLSLVWLSQHTERTSRKLFMWKQETEEQKDQIEVLKESNQKLVLNILPPHIAGHFIGTQKRDNDLLSQAYDGVGVMFAACPNFNDFYTEDAVNNNGLECLRFLNEIISDYDELLNESRFRSITKIKTIGPTYMAASGMNIEHNITPDSSIKERWQHLADLTEFAIAMKDELDKLNAQSFNTFVLRIGINQGPIIGGVIGARKPHYDIWGNTVNVASRMDSTGKAGRIQVVESTMEILTEFGYTFEKRGLVFVKGKGELMTYFLQQ